MDRVRQAFEDIGSSNIKTFGASGNVIFETELTDPDSIERKISEELHNNLGFQIQAFIRTLDELDQIVQTAPARSDAITSDFEVYIIFLDEPLDENHKEKLAALNNSTDRYQPKVREIYWFRRRKPGTTSYSTPILEMTLGGSFTIRSLNTIVKIKKKYSNPF